MNLVELTESNELDELALLLSLRSTDSAISHEKAEEVLKWMKENSYRFKLNPETVEIDRKYASGKSTVGRKHLNIIGASFKHKFGTYQGRIERHDATKFLTSMGYKVSAFLGDVANDKDDPVVGKSRRNWHLPLLYFW